MLLVSALAKKSRGPFVSGLRSFRLAPGQLGTERHEIEPAGIAPAGTIQPPLDHHKAKQLVKTLEAIFNVEDPSRIATYYSPDVEWRDGLVHFTGRDELVQHLRKTWEEQMHWHRKVHLWVHDGSRIGTRFEAEWSNKDGQWFRTYGNELLETDDKGLICAQDTAAYSVLIPEKERTMRELSKIRAPGGRI